MYSLDRRATSGVVSNESSGREGGFGGTSGSEALAGISGSVLTGTAAKAFSNSDFGRDAKKIEFLVTVFNRWSNGLSTDDTALEGVMEAGVGTREMGGDGAIVFGSSVDAVRCLLEDCANVCEVGELPVPVLNGSLS